MRLCFRGALYGVLAVAQALIAGCSPCEPRPLTLDPAAIFTQNFARIRASSDADFLSADAAATSVSIFVVDPRKKFQFAIVRGEEREPANLKELAVIDRRTVEFDLSLPREVETPIRVTVDGSGSGDVTCNESVAAANLAEMAF